MAVYFPLVMGEAPLLWLNNLPAGTINLWADLSREFTTNFQATYSQPGNAFNLSRVTMQTENMGVAVSSVTTILDDTADVFVALTGDQVAITNVRVSRGESE